ncbi:MAG: CPBP family intramembrane metalloprotease [Clostridia bacterium]|nr:CPBP family intramembrane metalloprotease [Clostridia bacterium]
MLKFLKSAPFSVPALTAVIYLLLSFCGRYIKAESIGNDSVFLVIIIIQAIVFAFPCFLYYGLKGGKLNYPMLSGKISGNALLYSIGAFGVMICGSLLLQLLFYSNGSGLTFDKGYMDALFAGEKSGVGLFLAYCLVPAVCEELFFRGIVIGEYKKYGSFNAVVISTLYFTLVHFSKEGFLIYMFAGLVLSITAVACRSVYPSMGLHLAFNMYGLYGNSAFISKTAFNTSVLFVGFVLFVVLLLSLAFMFSRLENMFAAYSGSSEGKAIPEKSVNNLYIYITPALIVPIAVFIVINALL